MGRPPRLQFGMNSSQYSDPQCETELIREDAWKNLNSGTSERYPGCSKSTAASSAARLERVRRDYNKPPPSNSTRRSRTSASSKHTTFGQVTRNDSPSHSPSVGKSTVKPKSILKTRSIFGNVSTWVTAASCAAIGVGALYYLCSGDVDPSTPTDAYDWTYLPDDSFAHYDTHVSAATAATGFDYSNASDYSIGQAGTEMGGEIAMSGWSGVSRSEAS